MAPCVQRAALLLFALLPFVSPSAPSEGLVVRVEQGALRGRRIQPAPPSPVRAVYAFEGVPYARPPVGERRFKHPEEAQSWTGIRNATAFGPNCIQITLAGGFRGEEDCLFLNVYTADPPESWATRKRPVIVFIHGGSFFMSSGDTTLARPDPLLAQGVIYVSMNYRLGVFGFLNTEDSEAPGNAALKDQTMALRWVQRNIAKFGGDPARVTVMGESAGAGSVHFHMLSPLSRGLFQRAVSVSGSVIPIWATVEQPRQKALALRGLLASACPGEAADAIFPCLRTANASELVLRQFEVTSEQSSYFVKFLFVASVEAPGTSNAPFLTAKPLQLLEEGRFSRVPYMTGFTSGEGLLYVAFGGFLQDPSHWADMDARFDDFRWDLPLGPRTVQAARQVRQFYMGNRSLSNANQSIDTIERFQKMCTDIYFDVGTVTSAKLMAENGGSVYVYEFTRDGPINYWKTSNNANAIPGVSHGDDMMYVFDFMNVTTGEPIPIPRSEQPIRERQQKLFANFAKYGNPTPKGSGLPHWPLYSPRQERFLDMGEQLRVRDHVMGERIAFWRGLGSTAQFNGSVTASTTES